ncbi:hypothetical protein GPS64_16885 [Acinetobacter haemolyticus]|nr:hypothetical protein [Acinetobacter haemolyticus]
MNIHHEIEKLFQQRQDIPLFYIESGSRLWGMASPDSDYDVRGFHLPSKDQYFDSLYTTNFIGPLSYQAFSFLKLLALS